MWSVISSRLPQNRLVGMAVLCAMTATFGIYVASRRRKQRSKNIFANARIIVISEKSVNVEQYAEIIEKHAEEFPIVGFDCEWITEGKRRNPVALLQISTHKHFVLLIRLCSLSGLPNAFQKILADEKILKVGVAPVQDAKYLYQDYAIEVNSCLDLRFLAGKGHGLASLAKKYLNVTMNKGWKIRCSNWEAETLTDNQIAYAAQDVLVAVEIFKKLSEENPTSVTPYLDVSYSAKPGSPKLKSSRVSVKQKNNKRAYTTRKTPLYDNCYMQAPDGELLCTCDKKKAEWYVEKDLGKVVNQDPYTVRLNFEPAGRAVGEVGEFYKVPKLNKCVVCGRDDSYIRKNVVPREYRKLFPPIIKRSSSHDVLLLCVTCHQKSNISDISMRNKLALLCNAPISSDKEHSRFHDQPCYRELQSSSRALLRNEQKMPESRRDELREAVLKYFPGRMELTRSMLELGTQVEATIQNQTYEPHGQKVVQYFVDNLKRKNGIGSGGITKLEQMWREHFIKVMQPKYLPEYWAVDHNKARLEIRAEEGRIDPEDLRIAGCDESKLKIN